LSSTQTVTTPIQVGYGLVNLQTNAFGGSPIARRVTMSKLHSSVERRARLALEVDRKHYVLDLDVRASLLDVLREHLHVTRTHRCEHADCDACTVSVDGRRIPSCLTLAVMHDGDAITTIERFCMPAGILDEVAAGCGAYPNILAAILGVVNGGRT
jgi:hypothetical protein